MCTMKILGFVVTVALVKVSVVGGNLFQPTAYTLPDGLTAMNGSNSTGACGPVGCLRMPYVGTTVNGCDCPGDTPASGVLIDGVIPSIDTTQRGTWASQLFVVNRNGRTSFNIGFEFISSLFLRHVSIAYLDCEIWNSGISAIKVYASYVFPTFVSTVGENLGTFFVVDSSINCSSFKSISIATQPTESANYYFVEFSFPSHSPLNWVHLGEISFSDMTPTTSSATESITTTPAEHETTTASTVTITTLPTMTTEEDNPASITSDSVTTADNTTTASPITVDKTTTQTDISVSVFVGTVMALLLMVIILIVTVIILLIFMKRRSQESGSNHDYDYAMERAPHTATNEQQHTSDTTSSMEMKTNEAYESHGRVGASSQVDSIATQAQGGEVYEEIH